MKNVLLLMLCLCYCLCTTIVNAQQEQIDSLEALLKAQKGNPDIQTTLLLEVAKKHEINSPKKALEKAEKALAIAVERGLKYNEIKALNILGALSIKMGNLSLADHYYHKALNFSEAGINQEGIIDALDGLGTVASYSKNFDLAKIYFERNLAICDSLGYLKEKAKVLSNLSHLYQNIGEMGKALQYQKEAIAIGHHIDIGKLDKAKYLLGVANIFGRSGQNDSALVYLQPALDVFKEINDYFGLAKSYSTKGNILRNEGNLQNAVSSFDSARLYYELIGNEQEVAISSVQAGEVLNIMGYSDKAVNHLRRALPIIQKGNNKRALIFVYQNYAATLSGLITDSEEQDLSTLRDTIIQLYILSAEIADELGDHRSEGLALSNLGLNYFEIGDIKKAIPTLLKSIQIRSTVGTGYGLYNPYLTLGKCYINIGDQKKALQYLQIADSLVTATNQTTNTAEFYHDLAKAYTEIGAFKLSNEVLYRYIDVRKQYYDEGKLTAIADIEEKYQTKQKELEIENLEKENALQLTINRNQRLLLAVILLGLLGLCLITYLFYRQNQERKRSNQILKETNEKIEVLHKELSHRVKNNLAFVSSLMRMQARRLESKEAKQAVKEGEARLEAMSLLHRKLYLQDVTTVDVGAYLDELCAYLQHSLSTEMETPKIEVEAQQLLMNGEDAMRLGLITNELVTNSYKYAFTGQEEPKINIQLSKGTNGDYQLLYRDNGKGLSSELEVIQKDSLGLKLIHTLTRQLSGQIEQYNDDGACFRLDFQQPKIAI